LSSAVEIIATGLILAAMPRWLVPLSLAVTTIAGAVLVLFGYATRIHDAICDPYNCASDATIATSKHLLAVGATLFGLGAIALVAWFVRSYVERNRGRPPRREPTLREW
jgi:hypothetical protein